MPVLPTFDASLAPEPARTPPMNPAAAAQVPAAVRQAGQQVADTGAQFEQRYADAVRQANAANAIAGASQQLGDLQFKYSHVADRAQATAGFQQDAQAVLQQTLQGIKDPLVQPIVQDRLQAEIIARGLDTQNAAFQLESSKRRGDLDANLFQLSQQASAASSPQLRAILTDNAAASIKGAVAAGWLHPEEGVQHQIAFLSNLDKADAEKYIRGAAAAAEAGRLSPLDIANTISDPRNFVHLAPQERQALADTAVRLGRTIVAMRTADEAHSEIVAERELRAGQAANAAALIAKVAGATPGQAPVDAGQLADLVRTGQLSEAGFSAVLAAQTKREAGRDDVAAATDLWRRANAGEDVSHDALADYAAGSLSRATVLELQKAVDARSRGGESAVDKANFATLKTALNGYAIEQGAFAGADKEAKAQLWTEAQGEWTRRVLVGRESSGAVLQDMLGRYIKQPEAPEGLPRPRLGAVGSLDDVRAVWAKTKAAYAAKQLDDGAFDAEKQLLLRYMRIYQAQADAAAARAKSNAGGAPKAQPVGPSEDLQ